MSLPVPCDPGIGLLHVILKNPLAACCVGAMVVAYNCLPVTADPACKAANDKAAVADCVQTGPVLHAKD
jgi:hypothetical protein